MTDTTSQLQTVITTIQEPTNCIVALHKRLTAAGGGLIAVGDRKGPAAFELPGARFVPLEEQKTLPFCLAASLPTGHYARKNLGYLLAISGGADCIYETDDDNAPNSAWGVRQRGVRAATAQSSRWVNAYRFFTDDVIWPRGLPLDRIHDPVGVLPDGEQLIDAPLQQGLADLAPDVDAVWRLVFQNDFHFRSGPSVQIPPGSWCPFNSQSTWWWPEVFPLLYLPSYCSFRMTDIWRSFIAQRCLWELDCGVVFHAAEVVQERNEHSLQRDFEYEVPGYLHNDRLIDALETLTLRPGIDEVSANLVRCYEQLSAVGLFPESELSLVRDWTVDVEAAREPHRHLPLRHATSTSVSRAA